MGAMSVSLIVVAVVVGGAFLEPRILGARSVEVAGLDLLLPTANGEGDVGVLVPVRPGVLLRSNVGDEEEDRSRDRVSLIA